MFSSKHIQQAVHLADEALGELNKAENGDQAYIVDCYLSALDYLIAALPNNSTLSDFPGSASRQALLSSKLGTLLDRTDRCCLPEPDNTLLPAPSTWLSLLPRSLSLTRKPDLEPATYQPRSHWTAQCQCGRHVSLQLAHEAPGPESDTEPILWPETIISILVSLALSIKNSPLPSIIGTLFTNFISLLIYLEAVFQIHQRTLEAMAAMVRRLAELDAELGIVQAIGNFISWLFESFCRTTLAFARAATSTQSTRAYNPGKRRSNEGRYLTGLTRNEGRVAFGGSARRGTPARIHGTSSQSTLLSPRASPSSRPSLRTNTSTPKLRRTQPGSQFTSRKSRSSSIESQNSYSRFSLAAMRGSSPLPEEEEEDTMGLQDDMYEDEYGWKSSDSSLKNWAMNTAGRFGYRASLSPILFEN